MAYGSYITKSLYNRAPYVVKNIAASLYGIRERRVRYGNHYRKALTFLRESQYWSNERLLQYRDEQVKRFVENALRNASFYRGRKEYTAGSDIASFPILSKQTVRLNLSTLYSDSIQHAKIRFAETSGTTGTPLHFPVSLSCFQREYAFRALHYEWGGVSLQKREKIVICAGHPVAYHARTTPPYWVHDISNGWLIMSSYHLSQTNLQSYVRAIERFQPVMIGGYPSSVYLLAAAFLKYGQRYLRLRSVITGSETLLSYQRDTIERAFGVKVLNWYGNSEMCANIVECEEGEMHLKLEHSAVEVLNDNDEPCRPGETGRLVCTGFGNYAFPLLRYDVGDVVTLHSATKSKCGRGGVIVRDVSGRTEDYIITPDGRLVGRLDHLFKGVNNVVEAQLVQTSRDEVVVKIVKAPAFTVNDERYIISEARTRMGDAIRISLDYVERIQRGKNGKFRFIESSLNQKEILNDLVNS